MDNLRFVLIVILGVLLMMLWEAWQIDYGPKPPAAQLAQPTVVKEDLPTTGTTAQDGAPVAAAPVSVSAPIEPIPTPTATVTTPQSSRIVVVTDTLRVEIDTQGGTIVNADLRQYSITKDNPEQVIRLFSDDSAQLFFAQSGLIAEGGSSPAPTHHTIYHAEQTEYIMDDHQQTLVVPLAWRNEQGVVVSKRFTFQRGSYVVNVAHHVSNQSPHVWRGRQYHQLTRKPFVEDSGNTFIKTYAGGVLYTPEDKFQKISFEDMQSKTLHVTSSGGWTGIIQHYFATAWIPLDREVANHFYTKKLPDWRFVIGSYGEAVSVEPQSEVVLQSQLFVGPKIQSMMEHIAEGLELTVDYGWLTFIGKPIYWLLNKIHTLVGNWGLAIMGVTLTIKLLFFKLSESSYRSMAKMRKIQPRLQQLKERYGDDKQRFNMEVMNFYRQEKVNPLGGCLPILIQIPVFISLYWVLIETVELRQAPFVLWIDDLAARDPYYVLPLLMGVTMWVQQKLNPTPVDPIQAKVMKLFPIIFTVFFLFFPAGLVWYWVVNNTLSILQQWYITRNIEQGEAAA